MWGKDSAICNCDQKDISVVNWGQWERIYTFMVSSTADVLSDPAHPLTVAGLASAEK